MAHNYTSLQHAQTAVRMAGYEIARNRMPDSIGPLIFVIHGDGNVARGAKDILNCMPVRYIQTDKLQETAMNGDKNVIYACVVTVADYMEHLDCKPFVYSEYLEQPERYRSTFIDKIAPYMSVLLNCTYWDERVDRILTRENVKRLKTVRPSVEGSPLDGACPTLPHRLLAICDISADLNGSVEFTDRCTTIDAPFVLYDLQTENTTTGFVGDGVLMCSIDNMPTQLPVEASEHFGNVLFPYLSEMAVITSNGQLTPRYAYIDKLRITRRATSHHSSSGEARKNVLVLGAGHVVPPLLEYLNRDKHTYLTVVSNSQEELSTISSQFTNLTMRKLDVLKDKEKLGKLMREHDLVISMVPWKFHPTVVKECIKQRRNLLTASYCTPVLKELEHSIQEAGITAFMEIGLDPGIDHLLTKECVDDVKQKGGRLLSYRSYTGGLPAPENSDNPLRYKFSWSPEAALSTVLNGAKYLENGKIREIPADGSLMKAVAPMSIFPALNLEGYPNRDSIRYIDLYGLEDCETVIRGTLRYGGYAEAMTFLLSLGLLNADPQVDLQPGSPRLSWRQLMCRKLSLNEQLRGEQLKYAVMQKVSGDHKKFECLNDLGLLSEDAVAQAITPLASISLKLSKFLEYGQNERDLIVMAHEMIIDWPKRRQREQRKVNLVVYGNPGQGKAGLAMSRTVGLPAAIAAKMILEGKVTDKGIVLPLKPQIYKPILQELNAEGIQAQETSCFTDA
ncbi:unnamed protein product [Dicrocoelium dendriticum]|nr:unnamed protein product [Dicrocoelium dendriticum]CAH8616694.1 unnamed protein product [Dicrocoelium dendriticum]